MDENWGYPHFRKPPDCFAQHWKGPPHWSSRAASSSFEATSTSLPCRGQTSFEDPLQAILQVIHKANKAKMNTHLSNCKKWLPAPKSCFCWSSDSPWILGYLGQAVITLHHVTRLKTTRQRGWRTLKSPKQCSGTSNLYTSRGSVASSWFRVSL